MQTFLPYPDFARSARVLDSPRLGKQRVETLQILRALLLPSYGWQTHPAVVMWRGRIPALTRYGLDMVDEWVARGHADSTAPQLAEFAPHVVAMSQAELAAAGLLPTWLGRENLHRSHRSNLLRKAPQAYTPLFPGESGDLPYVWPGADAPAEEPGATAEYGPPNSPTVWVLRPGTEADAESWRTAGTVRLGAVSPRGRASPKWRRQVDDFGTALSVGDRVAVLAGPGLVLPTGIVTGATREGTDADGRPWLERSVDFDGELSRPDVFYPALLQDPRSLFRVPLGAPFEPRPGD